MRCTFFTALLSSTAMIAVPAYAQQAQPPQQKEAQDQKAQPQQQAAQQKSQGQRQQIAASDLIGRQMANEQGQSVGRVAGVVERGGRFLVIEMQQEQGQVLLPIEHAWLEGAQVRARAMPNGQLQAAVPFSEELKTQYSALGLQQQVQIGASQQQAQAAQQQQQAQAGQQQQATGAQVHVEQQPAQVQVTQQPPEIIVRQPPPTITVQQPQPEIIVRMPEPQVAVKQPEPQVQIEQPQPRVLAEQAKPNVSTTRQAQPKVTFERTGEPKLQYQGSEGQPQVQIERMAETQQQTRTKQDQAQTQQSQQEQYRKAFGVGEGSQATNIQQRPMQVSQIKGSEVFNFQGEDLGSVKRIIHNPQTQKYFMVIGHGGFLGLGESETILPIERLVMQGDRLFIQGVTEADLESMGKAEQYAKYAQVDDSQQVRIGQSK